MQSSNITLNFKITNISANCAGGFNFFYKLDDGKYPFASEFEVGLTNLHYNLFGAINIYLKQNAEVFYVKPFYGCVVIKLKELIEQFNNSSLATSKSIGNIMINDLPDGCGEFTPDGKLVNTLGFLVLERSKNHLRILIKIREYKSIKSAEYFGKKESSKGFIELEVKRKCNMNEFIREEDITINSSIGGQQNMSKNSIINEELDIGTIYSNLVNAVNKKEGASRSISCSHFPTLRENTITAVSEDNQGIEYKENNNPTKEMVRTRNNTIDVVKNASLSKETDASSEITEYPLLNLNIADSAIESKVDVNKQTMSDEKAGLESPYEGTNTLFECNYILWSRFHSFLFKYVYLFIIKILNKFLDQTLMKTAIEIINMQIYIYKGTFYCRFKAFLGFFIINFYKNFAFSNTAQDPLPPDAQHLSKKKAASALQALQYATAAYSEAPLRSFMPCKIRNVCIADLAKKHILERVAINEKDLIIIYDGSAHSTPFCAFFNSSNQLVISLRGTSKPEDFLKVANCAYASFLDSFAHTGFVILALKFINEQLPALIEKAHKRHSTTIFITGHSMGGAVGILIYLILKNFSKFSEKINFKHKEIKKFSFKVTAFSAPPIVSEFIAKQHYADITVYCYENDIIPRLSLGSILDFKFLCISVGSNLLRSSRKFILDLKTFLKKSNLHTKLYCPGKIYYVGYKKQSKVYSVIETEYSFYSEIETHPKVMYDHSMNRFYTAFKSIINGNK